MSLRPPGRRKAPDMAGRTRDLFAGPVCTARPLPGLGRFRGLRIGLLGGSFNPAHDGHRHISLVALRRLGLNEVWWLVAPLNPLKSAADMYPYEQRLAEARRIADHPRIRVTDIERRLGTAYSFDTIKALMARAPGVHFLWLMGADNLAQFGHWHRWTDIVARVPLAILDRPRYSLKALTSKMAVRYKRYRLADGDLKSLAAMSPPAWAFLSLRRHSLSATRLREAAAAGSRSPNASAP